MERFIKRMAVMFYIILAFLLPSVSPHHDDFRTPSFRALAKILCEKDGNQQCVTKRRICYSDDSLPSSSSSQRILHIRSGWRFMIFFITTASLRHRSGWYLTVRRHSALLADSCQLTANSLQLTADSFYLLTDSLTTAAEPSHSLIMTPYRPPSFWAGVRISCEKDGK